MTKQCQEDYWYSVPECLLTRQYNDAYWARNAKSSISNQCPNLIDKNARIPFERNTERPVPICKYIQECLLTKQCQNAYWQSNTKIPINKATPKISIDKAMAWWLFTIQIFPNVLSAHFTDIISRTYSLFLRNVQNTVNRMTMKCCFNMMTMKCCYNMYVLLVVGMIWDLLFFLSLLLLFWFSIY